MSRGVTRDDLNAYLREHPEIADRWREADRRREEAIKRTLLAAEPLLADLLAAGIPVESLQDLEREMSRADFARALPILVDWLPRMVNPDVKHVIVAALATPQARKAQSALIEEFRRSQPDEDLGWQIGEALSHLADGSAFDDIAAMLRDRRFGRARQMLCLALARTGDPSAEGVLIEALDDDDVAAHAMVALGRLRSARARPRIEPFLTHPNELFRTEAKRALRRIDTGANNKA